MCDEGGYMKRKGMDSLIGKLADIREKFVLEIPEVVISLYSSADGIKSFPGHLLVLTLKHHLQLLPACVAVVSLISINVKAFQVV